MMLAYVNIFKPRSEMVEIKDYLHNFNFDGWGDGIESYSPNDVMGDPTNSKYSAEMKRINDADISYPIIINGKFVVDGVHRLAKMHLSGKKKIKAFVFTSALMKKFLIKDEKMEIFDLIELFVKRQKLKIDSDN